ncbi:DUF2207 domain-containing protein [Frankia sp. R43]|uniref:DUF2207 domain-containing protein n=1 Tax=Frankia sp. R43 TaxID=269536 RepID=UPI001F199D03|nr:DUF2207 domain-containing protein [Frankia sp. R43]
MSEAFSSWSPFGVVSHVVLAGPALALFVLGLKLMALRLRLVLWFRLRWGPPPSQIAPPEPSMNTDGGEGSEAREREERLEAELARRRAEWRDSFWGPAVAATVLDLARRGYLHISRDARHGLLVQRSAKPVEKPLAGHESTVLDLISAETAAGPLPADVLLTEAQPDGEKWHDWVTADALHRPRQYQRLVTKLWVASALFGLTYAMINGLIEADFWVAPEVRTENTLNSRFQAWFNGFFWGALLTAMVTGVFYAWTNGWRRSLHNAQVKRTTRAIDAEPALATATADEIERFGIALVYAAALGRAPAAVAPFTRAAASSTGSWTPRGGTPRFVTIDQPSPSPSTSTSMSTSTSTDADIAGSETLVGHVLRSWTDSSGVWVALDETDGRGDRTPARPIGGLVGPLPRRHTRVRLTRHSGQTTWVVSTLEHAPGPPPAWVALRDLLSMAELERLLPGGEVRSNGRGQWVIRHPHAPTVLIRVSLWASRRPPGRLLLALGGRRRHQPTPGTADVAGRHHALVRVGDVTALVLAIDRHRTDRQDTIAALVWLIAARLGAPVGEPPPALSGPSGPVDTAGPADTEEDRPSPASPS